MIGPIRRPGSRSIPPMILGDPLDPELTENSKNGIVGVRGLKNHRKKIFYVGAGPEDRSHSKPRPAASKKRNSLKEGTIAAYNYKHGGWMMTASGKFVAETRKTENDAPLVITQIRKSFKVRSQKQTD